MTGAHSTISRWDVVLVSNKVLASDEDGCVRRYPPVSERVDLADGLWIGPIPSSLAMLSMKVCAQDAPRTGVLYASVLENPVGVVWDPSAQLQTAVALSHFVRATETGLEYAATVTFVKGERPVIERASILTPYRKAWCSNERHRRWLTVEDALVLKELIAQYKALRPTLKRSKTGRALRDFVETPYLYGAIPRALVVSCVLEALVNSGSERSTAQFHHRVPLLAKELGVASVDEAWAKKAYSFRSALAHGGDPASPLGGGQALDREFRDMVAKMEDLTRAALRRALLDPEWLAALDDPQSRWPVAAAACATCRKSKHTGAIALRCPRCSREL